MNNDNVEVTKVVIPANKQKIHYGCWYFLCLTFYGLLFYRIDYLYEYYERLIKFFFTLRVSLISTQLRVEWNKFVERTYYLTKHYFQSIKYFLSVSGFSSFGLKPELIFLHSNGFCVIRTTEPFKPV